MTSIFMSYRRKDSISETGRIYDHLANELGEDHVFRDIDAIPLGVDFPDYIYNQIALCNIFLVVIGRIWVTIENSDGTRRLNDPNDFVRIEIETALRLDKIIIPILIDGATMPSKEDLPTSIRQLTDKNAAEVRHDPDFRPDLKRLIAQIKSRSPRSASLEQNVLDILPLPFEWSRIPASNRTDHFYVAKYPITNAQFQKFVEADDGYKETIWWKYSDDALQWRRNNPSPYDSAFQGAKRPRENVTWFEAKAFCQWLSFRTGQIITLPTHAQRVRVVEGDFDRTYPWGNEFDRTKCNTREFWLRATTDVDKYLDGQSSYGVLDLAGNVWEWGLLLNQNVGTGVQERALYGGGWGSRRRHTRSTHLRWKPHDYRGQDVGFRIYKINRKRETEDYD